MLEDARVLPLNDDIEADIAIVGGGAAGISLALNFINDRSRVVLLEGGGLDYEPKVQSLYRGLNVGLRYEPLDLCRVRIFGGSTDKRGWAGWCKTFGSEDFIERDWVSLSGWPITKSDLDPYYKRALQTVTLPEEIEALAALDGRKSDCLSLNGSCSNDPVPLSTTPHLSEVSIEKLRQSQSVRLILHANIKSIELDEEGRRVTGLQMASLEGRTFKVKAGSIVLAMGGIENARLLLAANQKIKTGIGNTSDWVGRCFMDHPRYAWGQITTAPDPTLLVRYNPTHGVGQRQMGVPPPGASPLFGGGISPTFETQKREKMLGSRTWILPVAPQGERDGGRELRELVLWATRHRVPADVALRTRKVLSDMPNAFAAVIAHLRSIAGFNKRWHFLTILEPEPNPDSRVLIDPSDRDQFGLPRVKLDWRLTPLVEHTLNRTREVIVDNLRTKGIECFVTGPGGPEANQKFNEPRWVWHHMGTTRMSADPRLGVVDADCKVHGMSNLYIAGSSVFPTVSTDMPTLTIIALAHRLADHLKARNIDLKRPVKSHVSETSIVS